MFTIRFTQFKESCKDYHFIFSVSRNNSIAIVMFIYMVMHVLVFAICSSLYVYSDYLQLCKYSNA